VSILARLLKRPPPADEGRPAAASPPVAASHTVEPPMAAASVHDLLRIEETRDAEFFAGDLFRRRFRQEPPTYPRHFVAFYRESPARYASVGYVHYTPLDDSYLCGGLVFDERAYRRMPGPHRALVRSAGGIAEVMLRDSFALLAPTAAIFGYVGDRQAEAVDLRVGFRRVDHPHVMVAWQRELPEDEKAARIARVIALGPF
jgi:hypothetical protein